MPQDLKGKNKSVHGSKSNPKHVAWFKDTGTIIKTACGKDVSIWEFRHEGDDEALSSWARHFRNHYCPDELIDALRGTKTRREYLETIKFPSKSTKLGPSTRAGDFAEILVCDFLQFILGFWVPRVRWSNKPTRDESTKGCDILGFQFFNPGKSSPKDVLTVFESKAGFSSAAANRLQDAVDDSAKDHIRIGESLNFLKHRMIEQGNAADASKVERFQSLADNPYKEQYGAAAILSNQHFNKALLQSTDGTKIPSTKGGAFVPHPNHSDLVMLIVRGDDMMPLVHELYRRAADEA